MLKDKITLNIAEAVKRVLNTEGRIDDLRDNQRVRKDTDWYNDRVEKKEKTPEKSNVKKHEGKYGKSNYKSMSEDAEELATRKLTKEDVAQIDETIEVSQDRYMRAHGKKSRSTGQGHWVFTNKGMGDVDHKNEKEVHHVATRSYQDAKKSAMAWARKHGHDKIYVMEDVAQIDEMDRKHEIYVNGKYIATTTRSKTAKEAKDNFLKQYPEHSEKKIQVNRLKECSTFTDKLNILEQRGLKGLFESLYSISEEIADILNESADFVGIPQSINTIRKTKEQLKDTLPKQVRKELENKIHIHRKHLEKAGFDFKESIDFDDIDFDKLLECVLEVLEEEPDNEQFKKELEIAKKKSKGDLRNDENIAKGKVDAVKVEEDLDEAANDDWNDRMHSYGKKVTPYNVGDKVVYHDGKTGTISHRTMPSVYHAHPDAKWETLKYRINGKYVDHQSIEKLHEEFDLDDAVVGGSENITEMKKSLLSFKDRLKC